MSNLTNELSIDELEAVSGGTRNLANDPGFHSTIKTSGDSPLFGRGSFHDTIDSNPNLP
jgi:bacteriocin-like protein